MKCQPVRIQSRGWRNDVTTPLMQNFTPYVLKLGAFSSSIPPSLHRKNFGFMNWSSFDEELWETIKTSSLNKVKDFNGKIIGF